jgi:hypothetical protein
MSEMETIVGGIFYGSILGGYIVWIWGRLR